MPGKLIMTWDIDPEHEQEYFEFVVRDFLPQVQKLGFQLSDAWVTVYGMQPQIMVCAILPSKSQIIRVINSEQWDTLINSLMDYVTDFEAKVVNATGGFQF
jgi:hypothetical protein